jgi:ubiquinone biosynthesis protein COQ4
MSYENMKPELERLKIFVDFAKGGGKNTENVFDLEDLYDGTPQMEACMKRMHADPAVAQLIKQNFNPPTRDLATLLQYPRGSLGYTYGKLLEVQGFDPHFYRDRPIQNDDDYCIMRVRKTHDIQHVVTGWGMLNGGEAGVVAINALQYSYPAFVLIELGGMGLLFHAGAEGFQERVDIISKGAQMARTIKPMMGIRWEEELEKPLDRWREELGITPLTMGATSWYESVPAMKEFV